MKENGVLRKKRYSDGALSNGIGLVYARIHKKMKSVPDVANLGQWLNSWIQPSGAIHGFHNHSVWGSNPYRYLDMTAGHSTFASPMIPALAKALVEVPDERGLALVRRLARFQCRAFQEDGQFAHVGFQVGEILKHGLIHNVVPDVSHSYTALLLKDRLDPELREEMDRAVRKNLETCDRMSGERPRTGEDGGVTSVSNQDYCRLWARLLHMKAFGHADWDELVRESLHYMIEHFHVPGVPDADSAGSLRVATEDRYLEPAEYYGLMITPLLLGYERYGDARFLAEARKLALHICRGSWTDDAGQRRFHRWYQKGGETWIRVREPMLIGGMGITLHGIQCLNAVSPDAELEGFLEACDRTYAHYQGPGGFFLAASGWSKEADIIPSSAWQSHDLLHLVHRHGVGEDFWERFFSGRDGMDVVLGGNVYWVEDDTHWMLKGYFTQEDADLVGRKDTSRFYREYAKWIDGATHPPDSFGSVKTPVFLKTDETIEHFGGSPELRILNGTALRYVGPYETLRESRKAGS